MAFLPGFISSPAPRSFSSNDLVANLICRAAVFAHAGELVAEMAQLALELFAHNTILEEQLRQAHLDAGRRCGIELFRRGTHLGPGDEHWAAADIGFACPRGRVITAVTDCAQRFQAGPQPGAGTKAAPVRSLVWMFPVVLVLDRATPDLDVGLAATDTILGLILGLLAFLLGTCWRITSPAWAVPPLESVEPIGSNLGV